MTRRDVLTPIGVCAAGIVLWGSGGYLPGWGGAPAWTHLVLLLPASIALLFRRVAPVAALAICTPVAAADIVLGASIVTFAVFTDILYAATVYGRPAVPRWLLGATVTVSGLLSIVVLISTGEPRGTLVLGAIMVAVFVSPVLTGMTVRQYRERASAERTRAEQVARLADLDRRDAITAERNRMARELHDVIANHLSAVALHSSAALKLHDTDPETVRKALTVIRENSVQGLTEMRQMIGLLRHGEAGDEDEPDSPRLAGLTALAERTRLSGLPVRLQVSGPGEGLPAAVELTTYRIVQESLTNALKHGGRGEAVVVVESRPDGVSLSVDSPLSHDVARDIPGSGTGLIGMQERASLLGGTFTAGAHEGSWRVRAELPAGAELTEGAAG